MCSSTRLRSKQEQQDSGALVGKRYCDKLFAIEKLLAHLPPEEIFQKRQEQAKPVLDEFSGNAV